MSIHALAIALASLSLWQPSSARQAPQGQTNPQILAQAYDRCMATYAVRESKAGAGDEDIYAKARLSCASLNDQLTSALRAALGPAGAAEALRTLEVQAKPNFLSMLARIRRERAGDQPTHTTIKTLEPPAFDARNPLHCEVALGLLVLIAEQFASIDAPDLRRRLVLAEQATAVKFSAEEAAATRKAIWPVIKERLIENQSGFLRSTQACSR